MWLDFFVVEFIMITVLECTLGTKSVRKERVSKKCRFHKNLDFIRFNESFNSFLEELKLQKKQKKTQEGIEKLLKRLEILIFRFTDH